MRFWNLRTIITLCVLVPCAVSAQSSFDAIIQGPLQSKDPSQQSWIDQRSPSPAMSFFNSNSFIEVDQKKEKPLFRFLDNCDELPLGKDYKNLALYFAPSCWKQKSSYSEFNTNHKAALMEDAIVCQCLYRSANSFIRSVMDTDSKRPKQGLLSNEALAKAAAKKKNSAGLKFSSYVYSANDPSYAKNFNALIDKSGKFKDNGSDSVNGKQLTKEEKKAFEAEIAGYSNVSNDLPLEPNQCVGGKEFLASKQLPEKELVAEIANAPIENFEKDWNYLKLRKEYTELMSKDLSEKNNKKEYILQLKRKIRFLDRNPVFKIVFTSPKSDDGQKRWLGGILKEYSRDPAPNKLSDIHNKIKGFTMAEKNIEFFKGESIEAYEYHPPKAEPIITKESVQKLFMDKTGKRSPATCVGDSIDVNACVGIYSQYCGYVAEALPKIQEDQSESHLVDDINLLSSYDFEPDIKKNPELQEFNNRACNGFKEFKDNYCAKKKGTLLDCQKDQDILAKFRRDESLREQFLAEQQRKNTDPDVKSRMAFIKYFQENRIASAPESSKGPITLDEAASNLSSMRSRLGFSDGEKELKRYASGDYEFDASSTPDSNETFVQNAPELPENQPYTYSIPESQQPERTIENMNQSEQRELLGQWKKEYSELQDKNSGQSALAPSSSEALMKERIAALEQLLAQQKKLSDDQYKLLNQTIAAQNKRPEEEGVSATSKGSSAEKSKAEREIAQNNFKSDSSPVRAPASLGNSNFGPGPSEGASNSLSRSSGSYASSEDSIKREEAKLNERNGNLVIETVKSGSSVVSAITLPVTDEQYKILQSNPSELNLAQLEQKIPKDQLDKLHKNGEIIIILQNGKNPPYEVKVEKKNNKLVLRLKDDQGRPQVPVRRINTLQALGLQFKNQ